MNRRNQRLKVAGARIQKNRAPRRSRTPAFAPLIITLAVAVVWPGMTLGGAEKGTADYDGLTPANFLTRWLVLGPIAVSDDGAKEPTPESQKNSFAADQYPDDVESAGAKPAAGEVRHVGGTDLQWKFVHSADDIVNLKDALGDGEFCMAYAWAEVTLPEAAGGLLGVGSDEGVKVWVNGALVHEHWVGRGVRKDDDLVPIDLKKGANRILLKIQNQQGDWGFCCRLLGASELRERLVSAAATGDAETLKLILARGVDVNATGDDGITAYQTARMRGYDDLAEYLASRGAAIDRPMPSPERLIDQLLRREIAKDSPGIALLVSRNGEVVFSQGYGLANLEHQVPVTPKTKFRIGSITKQFTAAAILRLQEQGKLSVTDSLGKFFPDYPRGDEVTLHHLLTHTSGIHSYTEKPRFLEKVTVYTQPDALIDSFQSDPFDFDPGTAWHYSNSGYFLLGRILEKVSGQSYEEFLGENSFEPLGMADTGVHDRRMVLRHEAAGYSYEGGDVKKAINWDMSLAGGAGALYSTVEDLQRWNEAVFGGRVLRDDTLKAALTPVTLKDGATGPQYGYGWMTSEFRGLKTVEHGGGLHGFASHLVRYPDQKFTIVVLSNSAPPRPAPEVVPSVLAQRVAEMYLWQQMQPRESESVPLSPELLDAYVGRYDYGAAVLKVTREENRIFAQLTGQPKFEIFPKSATEFFWKVVDARVEFVRDERGNVTGAVHHQGGQTINAPKLPPQTVVKVDPAILASYVGRYDYGGGQAVLAVTTQNGHLYGQMTGQPRFEIFPRTETDFFWKAVNAEVSFVTDDEGKVVKAVHRQGGRTINAPKID